MKRRALIVALIYALPALAYWLSGRDPFVRRSDELSAAFILLTVCAAVYLFAESR